MSTPSYLTTSNDDYAARARAEMRENERRDYERSQRCTCTRPHPGRRYGGRRQCRGCLRLIGRGR